tara:strand:+ start:324 stop:509 length:186 start_codon:yes stop_codon:yes gene_type:complete
MSGDNLYGIQPLKFYSREITETKIILIEEYLKNNNKEDSSNLKIGQKDWELTMCRWIDDEL